MHCSDNGADRALGNYWERCFCQLAAENGKIFTPMQIGRRESATAIGIDEYGNWFHWTLPDITIWTYPGEHHEIKHKDPTAGGFFGLERYRFDALMNFANVTKQSVLYTIHNHALNGGRNNKHNVFEHWFTVDVRELNNNWQYIQENGASYVNGQRKENIPIYYWSSSLWQPLMEYWMVDCLIPF